MLPKIFSEQEFGFYRPKRSVTGQCVAEAAAPIRRDSPRTHSARLRASRRRVRGLGGSSAAQPCCRPSPRIRERACPRMPGNFANEVHSTADARAPRRPARRIRTSVPRPSGREAPVSRPEFEHDVDSALREEVLQGFAGRPTIGLADAAKVLNMHVKTLRAHIMDGNVSYIEKGTGLERPRRLFTPSDLLNFYAGQRRRLVQPSPDPRPQSPRPRPMSARGVF
jgi:hypothetical protein